MLDVRSLCVVESEGPCPSHMIVMCRGRVFTFDALCDGRILTPPELLRYSAKCPRFNCIFDQIE